MLELLSPLEVTLKSQAGTDHTFRLGKFPAVAGREIVSKYPVANIPKLGDYAVSEETMLKCMTFVEAQSPDGNTWIRLTTRQLVDNHVKDWEMLVKLEAGMMEHNCSFFANGAALASFEGIAQNFSLWISKTLTALSAQLSRPVPAKAAPPSTN